MNNQTSKTSGTFDIYDFDKTIYKGDCSLDFYLFCVLKNPLLTILLPYQVWHLFLFVTKFEDRTDFKSHFFVFLRWVADVPKAVDQFWAGHYKYIKRWYYESDHSRDIIISASPEFLLQPAFKRLQASRLIATRMNHATGLIDGKNCHDKEKVVRLRQAMGNPTIDRAYTDSLSDLPILALAREKYIVKGNRVLTLKAYAKLPRIKKLSIPDAID